MTRRQAPFIPGHPEKHVIAPREEQIELLKRPLPSESYRQSWHVDTSEVPKLLPPEEVAVKAHLRRYDARHPSVVRRHLRRLAYIEQFGGACEMCGTRQKRKLEFAHRHKTTTQGMGRGQAQRLRDIRQNPRAYKLLCKRCHQIYDTAGEGRLTVRGKYPEDLRG